MSKAKVAALSLLFLAPGYSFASFGGNVSPKANVLFYILGLPVTNSMVTTWVISLIIIVAIRLMIGNVSMVPKHGQAFIEKIVESLQEIIEPIVGKKMIKKVFPLLLGFFTFILIINWSGLLPGVGTVGHWEPQTLIAAADVAKYEALGNHVMKVSGDFYLGHLVYYFRPGNTSLNNTFALAAVSFVAWFYFIVRYAGPKAIVMDIFGNKADPIKTPRLMYLLMAVIFVGVGFIEIVSIIFRPISLSFRLFGNMFGGENLLSNIHGIAAYIVPVPFYFLEVLIGLLQAFVFTLLVAVYIGLICNHEGGGHEHEHEEATT